VVAPLPQDPSGDDIENHAFLRMPNCKVKRFLYRVSPSYYCTAAKNISMVRIEFGERTPCLQAAAAAGIPLMVVVPVPPGIPVQGIGSIHRPKY
jgi:hypothetical protein